MCVLQILTFRQSLKVWRSISFLGHFLMVALILVSLVLSPRSFRKSKVTATEQHSKQSAEPKSSGIATWASTSVAGSQPSSSP